MTSLRFDPFREFDRWAAEMLGTARAPRMMPADIYRHGESYVLRFDLPGADPESLDVTAENSTLSVRAERRSDAPENAEYLMSERPTGTYSRQVVLGEGLNLDSISADYSDGVLTVTIPIAEQAKPRKIAIGWRASHEGHKMISGELREGATGSEQKAGGRVTAGS